MLDPVVLFSGADGKCSSESSNALAPDLCYRKDIINKQRKKKIKIVVWLMYGYLFLIIN